MRIKVEVTEKDIWNGKCGDAEMCAIAQGLLRAAQEKFGDDVMYVSVDPTVVSIKRFGGSTLLADTTDRAKRFIRKFDNEDSNGRKLSNLPKTQRVKPTTFIFDFA